MWILFSARKQGYGCNCTFSSVLLVIKGDTEPGLYVHGAIHDQLNGANGRKPYAWMLLYQIGVYGFVSVEVFCETAPEQSR